MSTDAIVEEVRQARQEYAKQFDYDLRAIAADLRIREKEHLDRLALFPAKPPRQRRGTRAS